MLPTAFIQNLNGPEIFLIFLVVLLLFGAKRLPELFRSFGKSIKEFKKATSEIEDDIRTAMDEEPNQQNKREADKPSPAGGSKAPAANGSEEKKASS
ncbi:MAG: twin-arginine translocase TatA/TatE family subunit [Opitutales bacterium]